MATKSQLNFYSFNVVIFSSYDQHDRFKMQEFFSFCFVYGNICGIFNSLKYILKWRTVRFYLFFCHKLPESRWPIHRSLNWKKKLSKKKLFSVIDGSPLFKEARTHKPCIILRTKRMIRIELAAIPLLSLFWILEFSTNLSFCLFLYRAVMFFFVLFYFFLLLLLFGEWAQWHE